MNKIMVSTTMTREQWEKVLNAERDNESIKTEISELQDALIELAEILTGGEEENG